jgi:hypothetical protein
MDPQELITGREKRELLVEESGKDPVCEILARNIALSNFRVCIFMRSMLIGFICLCRTHMA